MKNMHRRIIDDKRKGQYTVPKLICIVRNGFSADGKTHSRERAAPTLASQLAWARRNAIWCPGRGKRNKYKYEAGDLLRKRPDDERV